VPIAVFAFVFGLSMDYEVFILTRAREVWDRTGSNTTAIDESIATTGRLVTSAALILFLAFVALATVPVTDVKTFATALAIGIALDALVVRTILTPALVVLLGHLNWWAPAWLGGRSPDAIAPEEDLRLHKAVADASHG
jgi:RND superfamily putative drug exporter